MKATLPDSERERQTFSENGFIGPFTLWTPDKMNAFWNEQRKVLLDPVMQEFAPYPNNRLNYDRHLDIPGLSALISEPVIVHKLRSLIGPDILCWRTEFFPKKPGDPGTGWHQVETYAIGDTDRAMLTPTRRDGSTPIELTVWLAFTEATKDNGCLKFLPGSHRTWRYDELRRIKHVSQRENADPLKYTFFGYDYDELKLSPGWSPDEGGATHVEMRAGQFVIFTARCIHGSLPNVSRRQRMGFAVRVVPTHVKVYDGMTQFEEFGQQFDLRRYGCVQVSGEDEYRHNHILKESLTGHPFTTVSRRAELTCGALQG